MNFFNIVIEVANDLEVIANLIFSYAAYRWVRGEMWVTVTISLGSFRIKRKHFDLPTLTAVVSQTYFGGGWLPDGVRKELTILTTPRIKDLQVYTSEGEDKGVPPPQKNK